MSTLIGYNFFGTELFKSSNPPIANIKYAEILNTIVDELQVRTSTDSSVSTNHKDDWGIDTRMIAKFIGDLEAGNINNAGVKITKFAIKRRDVGSVKQYSLDEVVFANNSVIEYTDFTQPVGNFVYNIVPIGENALEGKPNEVEIESDFVGWWIVDKDSSDVIAFDKSLDTYPALDITLNQGRTLVETLSKYPQVYYTDKEYHTFSLTAVIVPSRYSFDEYKRIVDIITQHKPLIIKGSAGDIYVCDVSAPKKNTLLLAYKDHDYINLTIDAVEVQDYSEFMEG